MNLQHQPKSNSQQNVKNSSSQKDCFVYSMQVIFFKKKKSIYFNVTFKQTRKQSYAKIFISGAKKKERCSFPTKPRCCPWVLLQLVALQEFSSQRWIRRPRKLSREGQKQTQLPCHCWGHSLSFSFFFLPQT